MSKDKYRKTTEIPYKKSEINSQRPFNIKKVTTSPPAPPPPKPKKT